MVFDPCSENALIGRILYQARAYEGSRLKRYQHYGKALDYLPEKRRGAQSRRKQSLNTAVRSVGLNVSSGISLSGLMYTWRETGNLTVRISTNKNKT